MRRPRPAPNTGFTLFNRLEASFVTVLFLLLPCAIYWFGLNYWLAGTPWQLTGQLLVKILAGAAVLGFVFPDAIPGLVAALWNGILRSGYWFW